VFFGRVFVAKSPNITEGIVPVGPTPVYGPVVNATMLGADKNEENRPLNPPAVYPLADAPLN
jgi:hypothetical protein